MADMTPVLNTPPINTPKNLRGLYLSLIKKTLSYSLWPEPPVRIDTFKIFKISLQDRIFIVIQKLLSLFNKDIQIVKKHKITALEKESVGAYTWPVYADTMIGMKRLDNLQRCIHTVLKEGIEGDIIETGVWRGGACIFMKAVLAANNVKDRKIFVADSFKGLPKPDDKKYPADKGDKFYSEPYLAVSMEEVENNFRKYDLLDENVVFLEGWFKDTLPKAPINKLAILRLDGDMYGSTIEALECLYPKLSKGGFCIIDDYGLEPCKKAVDDFRAINKISAQIQDIDWTGRFWRKEN